MAEEVVVTSSETPEVTPPEKIDKAELDHALSDLQKWKQKAKELEKSQEDAKLARLKESQEWQKIAELKEQEANAARQESEGLKSAFLTDRKFSAVREAAMKAGIRTEALQDLDLVGLDSIAVETTSTGKINILGVEQFVSKMKATRPHWFGAGRAPNVNTADPSVSMDGEVTIAAIMKAQKEGNTPLYAELSRRYQQQKHKR